MRVSRTLYYVTNRKGSKDEPVEESQQPSTAVGRQQYYGPFRNDKLIYGKYSIGVGDEISLERLKGCESIPIDVDTNVLVLVHGFNSQFAGYLNVVADLAAEITDDVENNGVDGSNKANQGDVIFVLYSWPSMGSPFAYMQDECTVQYSYAHFKEFVDALLMRVSSSSKIHFVAHSLGCQLVYRYLLDRDFTNSDGVLLANDPVKAAGTVILSCPDLDYQTVSMDCEREKFSRSIDRAFILVSDVDGPLELSRALHGYTRLGRPAMPSTTSLFWGAFRTGSIDNIISTAAHAPELLARRAIKRVLSGFRDPDEVWQEENKDKGIEFANNIELYDFTIADERQRSIGHSICIELIASLFSDGCPPKDWSEEAIVKVPDEIMECSLAPYERFSPYKDDEHKIFIYKKLTPPLVVEDQV